MNGLWVRLRSLWGRGRPAAPFCDTGDPVWSRLRAAVDWDEGERRLNLRAYDARIEMMAAHLDARRAAARELAPD